MHLALAEAEAAADHDDVPIGAVIVRDGEPLAAAGNERELRRDPTAHAEVLALRAAAARLGGWRIPDSVLYVTLEPCAMCAGAIVLARVPRVVYAATGPEGRRGRQRPRRPGRAPPQPPPAGGRRRAGGGVEPPAHGVLRGAAVAPHPNVPEAGCGWAVTKRTTFEFSTPRR